MKLQLQPDSIRIRIGEAELATLQADTFLDADYALGSDVTLRLGLRLVDNEPEAATRWSSTPAVDGVRCVLDLGHAELAGYIARLPSRHGLLWSWVREDGTALSLSFEVDVRDSVGLRGPRRRPAE